MDDEELIRCFCEDQDMSALEILVRRYMEKVRAMVYAMVLNDMDADDITQDVFIRAARGLPSFTRKSAFSTWLYRIAMNASYTFLARRSRDASRLLPIEPNDHAGPIAWQPDEQAMGSDADQEITRALERLSPRLRAAMTMTALQGLTPAQAARVEGCSAAAMYWRIHQARKEMRVTLKDLLSS
jgi:RNA polymerase sigma-70 factor (ECF subfamily)